MRFALSGRCSSRVPARRLPAWYDELPHGLFYDESPNLIALARLFAGGGETVPLSARVQPGRDGGRTPAQVEAALTAGDVALTLLMHFEAPVSEWHVVVVGDRALAIVDLFRDVAVFTPGDRRHLALDTLRTSAATTVGHWAGVTRSGVQRVRGRLRYGTDEVVAQFHAAVTGRAARSDRRRRCAGHDAAAALDHGAGRVRILFLTHYALPHIGGIETAVEALRTELSGRGHEVRHVACDALAGPGQPLVPSAAVATNDVVRVPAFSAPLEARGIPWPIFSPRLIAVLARELRRADVVHGHGYLYMEAWSPVSWPRACTLAGPRLC